eukprot:CAMPEP_0195509132 /NCGR_PEP_ID=MMETSP0794_2-20130614/2151_1 /TAXON_ID=515487 /ORGANISM="Stephanopyxis turris, Strain CCMP 815" /LENGTH=403 /DNA_ID=CAMNT_0040636283 /DNA_START=725 /DNA_END=1936 /DNA_ORIENTATION=+
MRFFISFIALLHAQRNALVHAENYWKHGCTVCPLEGCAPEHAHDKCDEKSRRRNEHIDTAFRAPALNYNLIREQQTSYCPDDDTSLAYAPKTTGLPTRWIVQNKASSTIIISWVNGEGIEVSAARLLSPPHTDPGALVEPGSFRSFTSFQDHTFVAREAKYDESGLITGSGRPLLRKTLGMITVRNTGKFSNGIPPACPVPSKTVHAGLARHRLEAGGRDNGDGVSCHSILQGFRNGVGCPIDVYFTSATPSFEKAGTDCESFSFHLGTEGMKDGIAKPFDKTSFVGAETVYNSHSFAARMSHSGQLVDVITMETDIVRDCPDGTEAAKASAIEEVLGNKIADRQFNGLNDTVPYLNGQEVPLRSAEHSRKVEVNSTQCLPTERKVELNDSAQRLPFERFTPS